MTDMTPSSCILSALLADANGVPNALLFGFNAIEADALRPLLEAEDFITLTRQIPCLYRGTDPVLADPDMAAVLEAAGCKPIEDATIFRSNEPLAGPLPTGKQWVAGDWYLAPPAKPSSAQAASRALALQMVQLVLADADTHEIEALFRRDPALSYHLLRLVNSLGVGMGKKIASFSQAIVILGRQQLRRWLNLMLFSAREGDRRSNMLLARVAVRARQMELLAKASGLDKSKQELAFMAGMFSLLGILFGQPLDEVLKPLQISESLRGAVLEHAGDLGALLALIESSERADLDALDQALAAIQVSAEDFNLITVGSYNWMLNVVRDTQG
jgi:EAL and modified HD-GYP domain-containing signal transduction protein